MTSRVDREGKGGASWRLRKGGTHMVSGIYDTRPDFAAKISILTQAQGGRHQPPFNRIRWDLAYPGKVEDEGLFAIYPDFLTPDGQSIPTGRPLTGTLPANMFILFRNMVAFHRTRLAVGTRFTCHEGARVVATGEVTRLIGLAE